MTLVSLLVLVLVVALLLWAIQSLLTFLDPNTRRILSAVVVVLVVIWLLYAFFGGGPGFVGGWGASPLPRCR